MNKPLCVISGLILGSALAIAQSQPATSTDTNQPAASDKVARNSTPIENETNYGWIGLLGLAGLAGLKRRDRRDYRVEEPVGSRSRTHSTDDVRKVA